MRFTNRGLRSKSRKVPTVAKPELGTKRQCQSCGAKFYDLLRNPIVCPKCSAVFQVAQPKPSRGGPEPEEETEVKAPQEAELVPLEAADADATKAETPDSDVEESADEEDTFLEEDEEDGDDVSGLIDGEIEDDEEA